MPRVEQVSTDVYLAVGRGTNWCLAREDGAVTLFDAGWPKDYGEIVASLRAIGARAEDVRSLVLTHAHRDHMGAAAELSSRHDIGVRCLSAEEGLARGHRREGAGAVDLLPHLWHAAALLVAFHAITRGGLGGAPPLESLEPFEDGDTLDLPGHPVAIATPGHTTGHTAFHLPDAGVLLSGDALVADDLMTSGSGPRLLHDVYHHDPQGARLSLDRLAPVDADVVIPGHGEPIRMSPGAAVAAAREADR